MGMGLLAPAETLAERAEALNACSAASAVAPLTDAIPPLAATEESFSVAVRLTPPAPSESSESSKTVVVSSVAV